MSQQASVLLQRIEDLKLTHVGFGYSDGEWRAFVDTETLPVRAPTLIEALSLALKQRG